MREMVIRFMDDAVADLVHLPDVLDVRELCRRKFLQAIRHRLSPQSGHLEDLVEDLVRLDDRELYLGFVIHEYPLLHALPGPHGPPPRKILLGNDLRKLFHAHPDQIQLGDEIDDPGKEGSRN